MGKGVSCKDVRVKIREGNIYTAMKERYIGSQKLTSTVKCVEDIHCVLT